VVSVKFLFSVLLTLYLYLSPLGLSLMTHQLKVHTFIIPWTVFITCSTIESMWYTLRSFCPKLSSKEESKNDEIRDDISHRIPKIVKFTNYYENNSIIQYISPTRRSCSLTMKLQNCLVMRGKSPWFSNLNTKSLHFSRSRQVQSDSYPQNLTFWSQL